ncbi:hypothetical protein FCG15_09755 [Neisseria meningitidis]|nr:hypothetical protein [Neisseria meningitidis]
MWKTKTSSWTISAVKYSASNTKGRNLGFFLFYPIPSEHLSDGINIKTYRPFCDIIQAIYQNRQTLCRLKHACRTLSAP